jgi:hypothetical protein
MSRRDAVAKAVHEAAESFENLDPIAYAGPSWPYVVADAAITAYESYDAMKDPTVVPWDVWEWWNKKVGMRPGRIPGKEAAAAKRLVDMGITIGDLDRLWDWMKQDPWYAEKGIDLPLMAAAVLKWRAADAVRKTQAVRWDGHR